MAKWQASRADEAFRKSARAASSPTSVEGRDCRMRDRQLVNPRCVGMLDAFKCARTGFASIPLAQACLRGRGAVNMHVSRHKVQAQLNARPLAVVRCRHLVLSARHGRQSVPWRAIGRLPAWVRLARFGLSRLPLIMHSTLKFGDHALAVLQHGACPSLPRAHDTGLPVNYVVGTARDLAVGMDLAVCPDASVMIVSRTFWHSSLSCARCLRHLCCM